MPINPLILAKIEDLDVPAKIKGIIKKILDAEDNMEILGVKRNAVDNIAKILEEYDNDPEVQEFCRQDE